MLFNRVLLTGGYVYDEPVNSFNRARGFYRWRGHYIQPDSRDQHGERRIRLWVPWIRTETDSLAFIREFFRTYSRPVSTFLVEIPNQSNLLKPWDGIVRLLDRNGTELISTQIETLRVQFDHMPSYRMELGPADPHTLWPEPPHDERWEIPEQNGIGGKISLTSELSSSVYSSAVSLSSLTSLTSLTSENSNASTVEPSTSQMLTETSLASGLTESSLLTSVPNESEMTSGEMTNGESGASESSFASTTQSQTFLNSTGENETTLSDVVGTEFTISSSSSSSTSTGSSILATGSSQSSSSN